MTIRPALAYFGCVFGTGFLLGTIRVPLLVPRLGVRTAELLEMPFMLLAIVFSARWVVRRFGLRSPRTCLITGGLALAVLVTAELSLAALLGSLSDAVTERDPVSGSLYLVMLGVFALMPYFVSAATNGPGSQ